MVEFQNVLPAHTHIFWSHPDTSPCARAAEVLNQSESDSWPASCNRATSEPAPLVWAWSGP